MLDLFYGHIFVAYGYLYKKEKSRPKVILFLYILIYTRIIYLKSVWLIKGGNIADLLAKDWKKWRRELFNQL